MRERSGRLLIALKQNPRILERFWSRVAKAETDDGCWEWTGRCSPAGYPSFPVGQFNIAPWNITWFSRTGELPLGGRVHHLCENSLCVRPSHLAWVVGRLMERRLLTETDGYLTLAGVPRCLEERPLRVPQVVRLLPPAVEEGEDRAG